MITKTCSMCKETKSVDFFSKKTRAKDGFQSRCNPCMSKTMSKVYEKDRVKWNDECRQQKQRKYHWVADYKLSIGCAICDEILPPTCLEFHHLDCSKKESSVTQLVANKASDELINKEIEKCVIVCANHHRLIHAGYIYCEWNE